MISQIIRPLNITKSLLRLRSFNFSVSPTPNQSPNNNEKDPQIKLQVPNKAEQKESEAQVSISRAQTRLKISRSQLAKYARVELQFEKTNIPTQKMQYIAKQLQETGFKIKSHPQLGTRLQFHREPVVKKKPAPKQTQNNQNKDKKDDESESSEQQIIDQSTEKHEWEIMVLTSAQTNFVTDKEAKFFQASYRQKKQQEESMDKDNSLKKKKIETSVNFNFDWKNNRFQKVLQTLSRNNQKKSVEDDGEMQLNNEDRFKEFTVYLRNPSVKSLGKWVKLQLIFQGFQALHLYKMSVVSNMQQELLGSSQEKNEYKGVQMKELDAKLIELMYDVLQQDEGFDTNLFTGIYCYTKFSESQHYRKWLEDLIDICK